MFTRTLFAWTLIASAAAAAGCAPSEDSVVLPELQSQLARQYHACVPLGWNPVPVAGTYYPGANVVLQEEGVWLPAMWIARIDRRVAGRPDVRAIANVLDALTRAKMLDRKHEGRGVTYRLTEAALPHFFSESRYRNNREHVPYLCYSSMVPERILWKERARRERLVSRTDEVPAFRAGYTWHAGAEASWARDPVIRAHSVYLTPTHSPAVATFVDDGRGWQIERLGATEAGMGRVVDPSAWPSLEQTLAHAGAQQPAAP